MAPRLYSLYQKAGSRWNRISRGSYPKSHAVRVYQSMLLSSCFAGWPELRLRPVKGDDEPVVELRKNG